MNILKDKVAIVTGSSRGIGKAIAMCFAGAGCNVVVNYFQSKDKALEVAQEIEERGHGGSLVVQNVGSNFRETGMIFNHRGR